MELENTFVVPADVEAAWAKLLDVEAVAPCMPGATLTSRDGDEFAGSVKVKLGPVSMVYNGTARFVEADATARRAVIEAAGKDSKGTSTARATVRAELTPEAADRTRVDVVTDLAITGRPAQFGRGVMQDVAGRIIDQFAANLAHVMGAEGAASAAESDAGPEPETPAPAKKTATKKTPAKKTPAKKTPATKTPAEKAPATRSRTKPAAAASGEQEPPSGPPAEPAAETTGTEDELAATSVVAKHELPHPHDAIDLMDHAASPVLKRAVPVLAGFVVLWVLWRVLRRRG